MRMNMNRTAALVGVSAAAALGGASTAEAAPSLNGFGPAYAHDTATFNKQLDNRLRIEGADGPTALALGDIADITTHAGRVKYITPKNVDVAYTTNVSNKKFPGNTGLTLDGAKVVDITNNHKNSTVGYIEMHEAPKAIKLAAKRNKNADGSISYTIKDEVLRADCGGNVLKGAHFKPKKRKIHEKTYKLPVTKGFQEDTAIAIAAAMSQAQSAAAAKVECPAGSVVTVDASSYASAKSVALASASSTGEVFIAGANQSYDQFMATYNGKVAAYAAAAASAESGAASKINVNCAPTPTTPDVCPNIPGIQAEIPAGFFIDAYGKCIESKHDSEGPGAGTPGNVPDGGTVGGDGTPDIDGGAEGPTVDPTPTNPETGEICIDPADVTKGDGDAKTEGELYYGVGDQLHYCDEPTNTPVQQV